MEPERNLTPNQLTILATSSTRSLLVSRNPLELSFLVGIPTALFFWSKFIWFGRLHIAQWENLRKKPIFLRTVDISKIYGRKAEF